MTAAWWAREAMESAVRCGGMEAAITEVVRRAVDEALSTVLTAMRVKAIGEQG